MYPLQPESLAMKMKLFGMTSNWKTILCVGFIDAFASDGIHNKKVLILFWKVKTTTRKVIMFGSI